MATKKPDSPTEQRQTPTERILRSLLPWTFTIIFVVAIIVVLIEYQAKGVLTPSEKNAYQVLSIEKNFKELAKNLRPYVCRWFHPLIAELESFLNVLELVLRNGNLGLRFLGIIWLLIVLGAMTAPAILGVVYNIQDGRDYNSTYLRNGSTSVSNLTCYFSGKNCAPSAVARDQLAHAYGEITMGPRSTNPDDCGNFTDVQSIIKATKNYRYYCRRSTAIQEFGIRFNEYNIYDNSRIYPHFTNRTITASSGPCNEYAQVGNPEQTTVGNPQTDGTNFISAFNHTYAINSESNGSIVIPTSALGREGTTYIYRGKLRPQDAVTYGYGPRGLWMWAYRNPGLGRKPRFYECPVTVDAVGNVRNQVHNISDQMAREAAASIALQGQFKGPMQDRTFTQWQWYADGHIWNIRNSTTNGDIGANIAEHAVVSLAEMIANNPTIQVTGDVPYLGSKLRVDWRSFGGLMAGIVAGSSLATALSIVAIWKDPRSESDQNLPLLDRRGTV